MSIRCQELAYSYQSASGPVLALEQVTLNVRDEEFVCIVGPSGCGKTTLLKIIAGLLRPDSGTVEQTRVHGKGDPYNAMVFQEHGLYPWMSVLDNITLGLKFSGIDPQKREQDALSLARQFGLAAFTQRFPHELSVGMRQRVSLARAFIMNPDVLLMDEPFASLDALTKVLLQDELLRIWKLHRKQVLYITHDIDEALLLGDRVFVMSGRPGRIREEIDVPLERPRQRSDLVRPEMLERRQHIWETLEAEVRIMLEHPA